MLTRETYHTQKILMKRRIAMGVAAVAAVFATENIIDVVVSRYAPLEGEIVIWIIVAALASLVVYFVGEDRGDW